MDTIDDSSSTTSAPPERRARLRERLGRGEAVTHVAVAREEALQGAGRDAGLALEHPRRARRRRKAHDERVGERADLAQHRGLARARIALDADQAVGREQHGAHRLALARVEGTGVEPRCDRGLFGQCGPVVETLAHRAQDPPLRGQRARGRKCPIRTSRRRLDEVPVAAQRVHLGVDGVEPVRARTVGEREGAKRVGREDTVALLQVLHRAPHECVRAECGARAGRAIAAPPGERRVARRAELARALAPHAREHLAVGFGLLGAPRVERRLLRHGCGVAPAPRAQVGEEIAPARRECGEQRLGEARNLESRHAADCGGHRCVAHRLHPALERGAIRRAEELAAALGGGELRASPAPVRIAGHVRHHAVGVNLRIEIPAHDVAKGRSHHAVGRHAGASSGRGVVAACLQQFALEHIERVAHRLVVRVEQPRAGVCRGVHQRLHRNRLRRGERDVQAGLVLVLAFAQAPEAHSSAGHETLQHLRKALRFDRATQPERLRRLAVPAARIAVHRVVARVVPVGLEIVHGRVGAPQPLGARDHLPGPQPAHDSRRAPRGSARAGRPPRRQGRRVVSGRVPPEAAPCRGQWTLAPSSAMGANACCRGPGTARFPMEMACRCALPEARVAACSLWVREPCCAVARHG